MSLLKRKQYGPSVVETVANLTQQDLCDRCPAAGAVVVILPSGRDLVFCQHHANKYEAKLVEHGASIYGKESSR